MEQLCNEAVAVTAAGMTWREAVDYAEILEKKMREAVKVFTETKDFYKVTETHLRKKYNPEAEDEVMVLPKKYKLNASAMDVIGYMEDLIAEREKLELEIVKRKAEIGIKTPSEVIEAYEKVNDVLKTLRSCDEIIEEEEMRQDYKLNAKGEQVSYSYKVKGTAEMEFAHEDVLKELKKLNKKSIEWDRQDMQKLVEELKVSIAFVPKYDAENTLADDMKVYLAGK